MFNFCMWAYLTKLTTRALCRHVGVNLKRKSTSGVYANTSHTLPHKKAEQISDFWLRIVRTVFVWTMIHSL